MYELNIVIDEIEGEPSEELMLLMTGIVDEINKQAPQLEARLEVWEPVAPDVPDVPEVPASLKPWIEELKS